MSEKIVPGPLQDCAASMQEAVCINTKKIFDSCRDQDCIEELRFYPVASGQDIINNAVSIKNVKAELLHVNTTVEPINFNRGFYTVDLRYFYRVTLQAYVGCARPTEVEGLCVFDKRVILFGSESGAKVFKSGGCMTAMDASCLEKSNLPQVVVEAVDPLVLDAKLVDVCSRPCCCGCCCDLCEIPSCICECFCGELCNEDQGKRVLVTLGQFSIIRLERDTQLLIPSYSYCMPDKDCTCGCNCGGAADPCELFKNIEFPVNEFFPPNAAAKPSDCCCKNHCCSKR